MMSDNIATQASQDQLLASSKLRKGKGGGKKQPQQSESTFFNLNDYAKARILTDMLENKVQPNCRDSPSYVIMVLDDSAMKMISNFCSMFDLMESGNVYHTEKLELHRKRYPMSDVIYMVTPTQETIDLILADFPEKDEYSYDHYGSVHLCFLTSLSDQLFKQLGSSSKLVNKVRTMVEVNLDFKVWQDNVFKVPTKIKQLTKLISQEKPHPTLVENLSQKLCTICSVMGEKPFIQYQGDSLLCEEVATAVYNKLEYLYNYSASSSKKRKGKKKPTIEENQEAPIQIPFREPRGTLVILDRTFDMITPLIHDYQYQSTVFDYLPIPENGSLDNVIKPQKSKNQKMAASETKRELNEKDQVWQKYKNMHIAEVIGSLNEEIRVILQDQANLRKLSGKEDLHHDDIQNMLKLIPEFEKRQAEVLVHLDLSRQITDIMANANYNIMKLIEFEQTIISGVNDKGQVASETQVAKELTKVLKTLGRPTDKLRLLSIYLMCYGLPDSDFKTISKLVETKEERQALKVIRQYSMQRYYGEEIRKPTRILAQIPPEDFKMYQAKYKEIQEMYDILRCQPAIAKIAQDALDCKLDPKAFPFLGDEQEKAQTARGAAVWHKEQNPDEEGRIILGVIGGITHFEICCLQNLERTLNSQRLVIGSTQVTTAVDFIENLAPQKQAGKAKNKKRQLLDQEDEQEDMEEEQKSMRSVKGSKKSSQEEKKSKKYQQNDEDAIEMEDIDVSRKGKGTKKRGQMEDSDIESKKKTTSKLDSKKDIVVDDLDDIEKQSQRKKPAKKKKRKQTSDDDNE